MKKFSKIIAGCLVAMAIMTTISMDMAWAKDTVSVEATDSTESSQTKLPSNVVDGKKGQITTEDFDVTVKCGIGGHFRYGAEIPVRINITSLKADFQGIIRVIVPSEEGAQAVAYESDLLLTQGSEKLINMSVNNLTGQVIYIQVENEKGKVLLDCPVKMTARAGETSLVGVLSDDYSALNYFDTAFIKIDYYDNFTSQLVELDESMISDSASSIDALGYLIINSYDTSKLTNEQLETIKSWVKKGGILILGLGSDYNTTLSGIDSDLLSGQVTGEKEGSYNMIIDGFSTVAADEAVLSFTGNQKLLDMKIDGGKALSGVTLEKEPIIYKTYEKGHVIVCPFNLGMKPVVNHKRNKELASLILSASAMDYSGTRLYTLNNGVSSYFWNIPNILSGLRTVNEINLGILALVLFLFVILCPILYFVLKAMDKREWMWGAIPLLAVVFTIVVFASNSQLRIKRPIVTTLTVLNKEEGQALQKTTYLSALIPNKNKNSLNLRPEISNFSLMSSDGGRGYYNFETVKDYDTAIKETAQGLCLTYDKKTAFDSSYAFFNDYGDKDVSDGIKCDLKRTIKGIEGKVTNNTGYDLRGVTVFISGKSVMIGRMEKGQTVNITYGDNLERSMDNIYNIEIKGEDPDSRDYTIMATALEMMYSAYMNNDFDSENDPSALYVQGYIDNWDNDYVTDEDIAETNVAVYLQKSHLGLSDYKDGVEYKFSSLAELSEKWDTYDGQLYSEDFEIILDVDSLEKVYAITRVADKQARFGTTEKTKLYIYNFKTDAYEEMFTSDLVFNPGNMADYISDYNTMKIKVTCEKTNENYMPSMTIIGKEVE